MSKSKLKPKDVRPGMTFFMSGHDTTHFQVELITGKDAQGTLSTFSDYRSETIPVGKLTRPPWSFDSAAWAVIQGQDGVALTKALGVFRQMGLGGNDAHEQDDDARKQFEAACDIVIPHLTQVECFDVRVGLVSGDPEEWVHLCDLIERRLLRPVSRA